MKDYPKTLAELEARFLTEEACREYMFHLRWPDGFVCPKCDHREGWAMKSGLFRCASCKHKASLTAGTIFQDTRKPLTLWFRAIWWVVSQKNGASALGLKRILGFGSYETAWTWLQKLRRAMVRPGRERLSGKVEVDETYVGGSERGGKRGRGTGNKEIVAIAVEVHSPKGFGRVRMRRIPDISGASLVPFVCDAVEPGSEVLTDGLVGYNKLSKHEFAHTKTILASSGDPAHIAMPGVHRVASLLKRWLLGTHQGAVSGEHLEYYLDEFTFRFNRRTSRSRGLLFYRLLQQAVQVGPSPYEDMIAQVRGRKRAKNHNI